MRLSLALRARIANATVLAVAGLVVACASAPPITTAGAQNLPQFLAWFGGEFDNHEQVWQQRGEIERAKAQPASAMQAAEVDIISHTHHVFAPVKLPALGAHVFYVQQNLDADPAKVYRQRLYRITNDAASNAIKLEIFSLPNEKEFLDAHVKPEKLAALDIATLRPAKGCDVFWRLGADKAAYEGTMTPGACNYVSPRLNKRIIVSDTLRLTASELWINDQARDEAGMHVFGSKTNTPVKNRKVRYFTGWAFGTDDAGRKLRGERSLMIHNEGHMVGLSYEDGSPSPYKIQLAQLTYQNTSTPILKLALMDSRNPKSTPYTWANIESARIGMNLGWIQFGLTQKANDAAYGFATQ